MDKEKLFKEIIDWYNWEIIKNESEITVTNGESIIQSETLLKYKNYDEALKDWLATLKASNDAHSVEGEGDFYLWSKEEIEFIENL